MKVWVQLVDSEGASYRGSSADKLTLADDADVADLRDAIKIKNKDILKGITASQLVVYSTRDNLDSKNPLIRMSTTAHGLGLDEDNPVFIVVPDDTQQAGVQEQLDEIKETLDKLTIKVLILVCLTMKERPKRSETSLRKKVLKKVARAAV